jgi:hypothetical protein
MIESIRGSNHDDSTSRPQAAAIRARRTPFGLRAQREHDGRGEHGNDDPQRQPDRRVPDVDQQHLRADDGEDQR